MKYLLNKKELWNEIINSDIDVIAVRPLIINGERSIYNYV